jgi:hypothetical protein
MSMGRVMASKPGAAKRMGLRPHVVAHIVEMKKINAMLPHLILGAGDDVVYGEAANDFEWRKKA